MLFWNLYLFLFGIIVDKLTCIEIFTHVARLGSFTAVANELNITQSAVSKKVAWLEKELGLSLLHRNPRKVTLTNVGEKYVQFSQSLIEHIKLTEENLRGELSQVTGSLRISAPSAFATQLLAKPISDFVELHPDVKINVSVTDRHIDLYNDDIDIAIRAAHLKDSGLKAKKLMDHELCYFASHEYIKEFGEPCHPDQLSEHHCITYSLMSPSNIWTINQTKYMVEEVLTSDNPEVIVQFSLLGKGIAAMPRWMVQSFFESNQLKEIFIESQRSRLPMYAVYKGDDYLPHRIRTFVDYLSNYFE